MPRVHPLFLCIICNLKRCRVLLKICSWPRCFGKSGFGIAETLVAAGILGTMAMTMATLVAQQNRQILSLRLTATRDQHKNLAEKYISDIESINTSLNSLKFISANDSGNQFLNRCLNGNGIATTCPPGGTGIFPDCCVAKDAGGNPLSQDFFLADPGDPSATNKKRFAGTNASPARYDIDGAPCATASSRCILELVTSFIATCAGGAVRCAQAAPNAVRTRYEIRLASGFSPPAGPPLRAIVSSPVLLLSSPGAGGGGGIFPTPTPFPTPPECTNTQYLKWTTLTSKWSCQDISTQGGTPCGPGNEGVTMYGMGAFAHQRYCCLVSAKPGWSTYYFGGGYGSEYAYCKAY